MNMPGLTAHASLYQTAGSYRQAASSGASAGSVTPQLWQEVYHCTWDGSDLICGEGPFGGGVGWGGGPDPGDLACRRCLNKCNTKPPGQRAACRAKCDDIC